MTPRTNGGQRCTSEAAAAWITPHSAQLGGPRSQDAFSSPPPSAKTYRRLPGETSDTIAGATCLATTVGADEARCFCFVFLLLLKFCFISIHFFSAFLSI